VFTAQALARLEQWAASNALHLCPPKRTDGPHSRAMFRGKVKARLFGCVGPGGPLLDLQTRGILRVPLPEGWCPWAEQFGVTTSPPTTTRWTRNLLVPREWKAAAAVAPGDRGPETSETRGAYSQ
jgi:hypothetical protein